MGYGRTVDCPECAVLRAAGVPDHAGVPLLRCPSALRVGRECAVHGPQGWWASTGREIGVGLVLELLAWCGAILGAALFVLGLGCLGLSRMFWGVEPSDYYLAISGIVVMILSLLMNLGVQRARRRRSRSRVEDR